MLLTKEQKVYQLWKERKAMYPGLDIHEMDIWDEVTAQLTHMLPWEHRHLWMPYPSMCYTPDELASKIQKMISDDYDEISEELEEKKHLMDNQEPEDYSQDLVLYIYPHELEEPWTMIDNEDHKFDFSHETFNKSSMEKFKKLYNSIWDSEEAHIYITLRLIK